MDNMNNQQNYGPVPDSQDGGNKALAVLSYILWIVGLVALLVKKDSPYVKFHSIQGIALAICNLAASAIAGVLGFIIGLIFEIMDAAMGTNGGLVSLATLLSGGIGGLIGLAGFVLMIFGIINAIQGTMKPLPLIGNFIDEKFNK
ncbi:MAG: DUF4870 domain-containing protein [Lachnospiraceae bacterium]|nr:DUF4870 domain-containing protein [Lachnospiraceae bacterium]